MDLRALSATESGSAVPLTWSAALRVNHDIIIQASIAYVGFVSPLTFLILFSHLRVGRSREHIHLMSSDRFCQLPVILSGYWRSLWSSPDFADHTLKDCVNIIHDDIVEIWNLNDIYGVCFFPCSVVLNADWLGLVSIERQIQSEDVSHRQRSGWVC
jgi:hypothetical protein